MSSDFSTVLIEDSVISGLTDEMSFGVISGASQKTYQPYTANSVSNSTLTFNVQVPSESIVINRHVLIETDINLTLTATGVPNGAVAWNPDFCSFNAFPFHQLLSTSTNTINNATVSTQVSDVLPALLRMNDPRVLSKVNSFAPNLRNGAYANLEDGWQASNNANAGYRQASLDSCFMGKSALAYKYVKIERYNAAGVYQDADLASTAVTDTWKIYLTITTREPIGLCSSPWVATAPDEAGGIYGINSMNWVYSLDATASRVYKAPQVVAGHIIGMNTVQPAETNYITSVSLGAKTGGSLAAAADVAVLGLVQPRLLFEFNTLSPIQAAKLSGRCVSKFLDFPRYVSQSSQTSAVASSVVMIGDSIVYSPNVVSLTTQSIQLNQIPDLMMIFVRNPVANQTFEDGDGLLAINGIRITFNNGSGILSTALQPQLYDISRRNGLNMPFQEFQGYANASGAGANSDIIPRLVSTGGSMLVFNPAKDFSLPEFLSASSLGQFNFFATVDVYNQYGAAVTPEIVVLTMNSGLFCVQAGQSQIYTGILTKDQVMRSKESKSVPALSSGDYARLVGGSHENLGMGHIKSLLGLKKRREKEEEGGSMSGGATSGGRLHRYLK